MDSLILCKFLRGVFEDPFPEWARCSPPSPAGTSTAPSWRRPRAGSCSPSARSTPARGGRGRTTRCPTASSKSRSRWRPAASASLTRERLDAMILGYYEARGLDRSGLLATEQIGGSPARARTDRVDAVAISTPAPTETRTVSLTIDGRELTVPEGTTIWQAAKDAGIEIPVLCHDERYDPVGVCRMCVVDVGARVYAASCVRPCEDGMEVKTDTPELERNRAPAHRAAARRPAARSPRIRRRRRPPTTSCSCSSAATACSRRPRRSRAGRGAARTARTP